MRTRRTIFTATMKGYWTAAPMNHQFSDSDGLTAIMGEVFSSQIDATLHLNGHFRESGCAGEARPFAKKLSRTLHRWPTSVPK